MRVLWAVAAAFSMFSAIPMPMLSWGEETMRYMLGAFPVVGVLIGALEWGWHVLCSALGLPVLLRGLGLSLIPVFVTGGIHLDGYCDTWDALASRGTAEQKRAILKDPHIGVFAAVHLVALMMAAFVIWSVLPEFRPVPVLLSFVLSRGMSGLGVMTFPVREGEGMARSFAEAADRRRVTAVCAVWAAGAAIGMCLTGGWVMVLAAAVVFLWYRAVVLREFGGLSGDLAGWFLQEAELWMLAALYVRELLAGA